MEAAAITPSTIGTMLRFYIQVGAGGVGRYFSLGEFPPANKGANALNGFRYRLYACPKDPTPTRQDLPVHRMMTGRCPRGVASTRRQLLFAARLRRLKATKPTTPEPNSRTAPGSGTGETNALPPMETPLFKPATTLEEATPEITNV